MMKSASRWLLLLMTCLLPGISQAKDTFHVGIFAYRPVPIMTDRWQHLEMYLEKNITDTDFILHILDLNELEKGVQQNRFDFVFTNPRHFIQMRSKYPLSGALGTLVRLVEGHPVATLGGVIIARSDNETINELPDIVDHRIASPGPGFLGGYQAQVYELDQAGFDIAKLDIDFTGAPHDRVIEALRTGEADVGFVRTSAIEQMVAEGKLSLDEFKIINPQPLHDYPFLVSTRLYPEWPFVALPKVREDMARKVASTILGLDSTHTFSRKIGISGFTIPADYLPVEQTMRELRLPPFDHQPPVSFSQIWSQHQRLIIILAISTSLIIGLLLVIARKNVSLRESKQTVTRYLREIETRHQFLRSTFSAIPDLVWIKDPHGVYLDCNARFETFLGKHRQDIIGHTDGDHIDTMQAHEIENHDREVIRMRLPSVEEDTYQFRQDGHEEVLEIIKTPVLSADNQVIGLLGIGRDITDRKKAERELRLSNKVFENTLEGIMVTDHDGRIVDTNPAFSQITGYSREEVLGEKPSILNSGRQSPEFYQELWQSLQQKGHWRDEVWNRKKSGELYAESLSISSLKDEEGNNQFYVGIFSDITDSKEQQEKLSMMAHYDVLTTLPNRALFADRFNQAIMHSRRNQTLLAICFIDLDNFKPVNDKYGHEAGDQLLVEVASRLMDSVRGEDTVSRLGGDEFALLLNDIDSQKECLRTLDRVLYTLEKPFEINGVSHYISASIGTTLYPIDDEDVDTLLRHADQAMYQAKLAGKHRFQLFDSDHDRVVSQKQVLIDEVKQALYADQLTLHYQPKVNMRSGEVFGVEALLRWNHPERGLIMPMSFLPELSGSELDVDIGEWVIVQAIKQINQWQQLGIEIEISVNIGSHHLQQSSFVSRLGYALEEYPEFTPSLLQLEVLESSVLGDLSKIRDTISACQNQLGVSVALDDFGTGYSSLTHLRSFTANMVKIDKGFIQAMLDDPNDYMIVDGVIGLADSFGRSVIAEGVETTEHGLMLLAMGCDLAQGYGIARPMPANDIPAWLERYRPEQAWSRYAARHPSSEYNKTMIMKLAVEHWHQRFVDRVKAGPEQDLKWPLMDTHRCHCGAWLASGDKELLFQEGKVKQLEAVHREFHGIADDIAKRYQHGELELARAELSRLLKVYKQLLTVLNQCHHESANFDENVAGYSRGYL